MRTELQAPVCRAENLTENDPSAVYFGYENKLNEQMQEYEVCIYVV